MIEKRNVMTIALIYEHLDIYLAMKKRGFGEGRWNGFGGKVDENESIEGCVIRECKEEVEIEVKKIEKRGKIEFRFQDNPGHVFEVHIYIILEYAGIPKETEEMRPKKFHVDEIPYNAMWPADKQWFPYLLKGSKFQGTVFFKNKGEVLKHDIIELPN